MDKQKDSPVLYTEDTQTPTNVNTTVQAPITKDAEGNILEQYKDSENDKQYASTPDTSTNTKDSALGDGLSAAEGTEYSWEKNAKDRANLDYQSAILESKSNYLTNRQELETQGQEYQEQIDMQKYAQNQSNEKAGWTGGYVLDTERQMEYLKQGIQSQMYGAMELQKYGYDTSLAAARLAYDTNKYDLALEYYNTALSRAVTQAELTGYYIAPEVSEHLNQYSIASSILNSETATEEEKLRADKVLSSVYNWFESNGISKQGAMTVAQKQWIQQSVWAIEEKYENLDATYKIDTDTFVRLDDNGNPLYLDGMTDFDKINFETSDEDTLYKYICNSDGSLNQDRLDQYYSRVDALAYEMENNFKSHMGEKGAEKKTEKLLEELKEWLKEEGTVDLLKQEINRWDNLTDEQVQQLFGDYKVTISLPNGEQANLFLSNKGTHTGTPDTGNKEDSTDISDATLEDMTDLEDLLDAMEDNTLLLNELNKELGDLDINKNVDKWVRWGGTIITDTVMDIVDNFTYEDDYYELTDRLGKVDRMLGQKNLEMLKANSDKYNNLSERDRDLMDDDEIKMLKQSSEYYAKYKALKDRQDYVANRYVDHSKKEFYAYTKRRSGQMGDIWEDGYQFGDVAATVSKGVSIGVTAVGETVLTVFGKGWLW